MGVQVLFYIDRDGLTEQRLGAVREKGIWIFGERGLQAQEKARAKVVR